MRITQDERALLKLFGTWRSAVFNVENTNAGNLQLLLSVCRYIEREAAQKKANATGENQPIQILTDQSKKLRKFIHDEFGRWPPDVITTKTMRLDAEQLTFEMGILNKNLRHGEMVE